MTPPLPLAELVKKWEERSRKCYGDGEYTAEYHLDRCIDELRALPLGRCETCREWQPIETAPQMRKILVSYVNALGKRRVVLACYYLANALAMDDDYADVGIYDEATGNSYAPEGWYEEHDSDNPIMSLQADPTHWMPLPPAPPAAGEETR